MMVSFFYNLIQDQKDLDEIKEAVAASVLAAEDVVIYEKQEKRDHQKLKDAYLAKQKAAKKLITEKGELALQATKDHWQLNMKESKKIAFLSSLSHPDPPDNQNLKDPVIQELVTTEDLVMGVKMKDRTKDYAIMDTAIRAVVTIAIKFTKINSKMFIVYMLCIYINQFSKRVFLMSKSHL